MLKSEIIKIINKYFVIVKNLIAKKNTVNVFKTVNLVIKIVNALDVKIANNKFFLINKFQNNHF